MQSITIVWKPIYIQGIPTPFYHEFLLYDDGVNTYYIRGGPGSGSSGGSEFSSSGTGSGPGTGPIVVEHGPYVPGTPDFPSGSDPFGTLDTWPQQNVISGDLDLSSIWSSMIDSAERIGAARIPYNATERNSNSVAGTVLDENGFTPPQPPVPTPSVSGAGPRKT